MSDLPLDHSGGESASANAGAAPTKWSRISLILRLIVLRLRFFVVLGAIFVVLASWEKLGRVTEWVEARLAGDGTHERSVSPDSEYFCPMCPGVLSTWPEQCPVCKMPLVRRQKGEAVLLPEGVLARMQLSPYRIQLAGIKTTPVRHYALQRTASVLGRVASMTGGDEGSSVVLDVHCEIHGANADLLEEGEAIRVSLADQPGEAVSDGVVVSYESVPNQPIRSVRIKVASGIRHFAAQSLVQLQLAMPLAEIEPYRSQPRDPQPRTAEDRSEVYICHEHPTYVHAQAGKCPFHDADLHPQVLRDDQRLEWFCPAHVDHRTRVAGDCPQCSGLPLVARILNYSPPGQVLAIPEAAVIDTGERQWTFVESAPGMFDAVPIQVGERCGDLVPVISGLELNQRVVSAGAFLLDAETRLSPNVAASYFGAGVSGLGTDTPAIQTAQVSDGESDMNAMGIGPGHLARIRRQSVCPVTKFPLGSMGAPTKVRVGRDLIYLCCEGCIGSVRGGVNLGSSSEADIAGEQPATPDESSQSSPSSDQGSDSAPKSQGDRP